MSHISRVWCQISDLDAAAEACAKFNATLHLGQRTHKSFAGASPCAHAITLNDNPRAYEVGLVAVGDHYDLAFDSWGPGGALVERFGPGLVDFQNEYQLTVAERELRAQGYMTYRGTDEQQRVYVEGSL